MFDVFYSLCSFGESLYVVGVYVVGLWFFGYGIVLFGLFNIIVEDMNVVMVFVIKFLYMDVFDCLIYVIGYLNGVVLVVIYVLC